MVGDYIFSKLDENDLQELTALERRLTARHQRPVVLVAFSEQGNQYDEDALASLLDTGFNPADYGIVQATQENGAQQVPVMVGVDQ